MKVSSVKPILLHRKIVCFLLIWITQYSICAAQPADGNPAHNTHAKASALPNIVLVVSDDLGYGDLACYGHREIVTPNLDHLAKDGLLFKRFYAGAANCSPSRAALMTGRNPYRVGIYHYLTVMSPMHLVDSEVTVATLLKEGGYTTAQFGKWHLNGFFNLPGQPQPNDHGFDYWFSVQNNALPSHKNPYNFVRNGVPEGPTKGYSASIVAGNAVNWLSDIRERSKPFFLYVCFNEPHESISTDPSFKKLYAKKYPDDPSRVSYYGNVTQMDNAVGHIMRSLDSLGLSENTIVIFTSDNGPATTRWHNAGSTGGLRGRKGDLYEGGIRVPGIIKWPGRIKPGSTSFEPVSFVDVLPTLCQIAGIDTPSDRTLDGVSIVPTFTGGSIERIVPLYWKFAFTDNEEPQVALIKDGWKLLGRLDGPRRPYGPRLTEEHMKLIKFAGVTNFELYNLDNDSTEAVNLIIKEPKKFAALKADLEKIHAQVRFEGPVWPSFSTYDPEEPRTDRPEYYAKPLSDRD